MTTKFNPSEGKAPCFNCRSRKVGCHAECERYTEFVEAKNTVQQQRKAFMEKHGYVSYSYDKTLHGKVIGDDKGDKSSACAEKP